MTRLLGLWLLFAATSCMAQGVDNGADDVASPFANEVSNVLGSADTQIAEIAARERRVITKSKLGLLGMDEAAHELLELSNSYFFAANYGESSRLATSAIDIAPKSYDAARGWIQLGHIAMMSSSNFKDASKAFKNADKVLKMLIAKKPDDLLYRSRSVVLDRLGLIADCTQQPELACQYYQEMIDSPDVSRCAGTDRLLVANQVLAIDYDKVGNREASMRHFDVIEKAATSGTITPDKAIPLLLKRIHIRWPDAYEPDRIQAIERLWNTDRYKATPEILSVGDELACAYFFGIALQKPEFEKTVTELLLRLDSFRDLLDDTELSARVPRVGSIEQTALVLLADFQSGRSDKKSAERSINRFNKEFLRKPPQLTVPDSRPIEQLENIFRIYKRVMTDHWREYQQLQADLKDL